MDKQLNKELQEEIKKYNLKQQDKSEHVTMQDVLAEVGSNDNEEVLKAIELLRSKTENCE